MINAISSIEEYHKQYTESIKHPDTYWASVAELFTWRKPWETVRSGNFTKVNFKWYDGAQLNITENCLDRHLNTIGDKTAIIWEPNNPADATRHVTYKELHRSVCKLSNALQHLGVLKGDTVCIYMPMVPEAVVAMLACARIGAIHSVVFAGFSAQSIAGRIQDAGSKWMITADGFLRGDKRVELKAIADEALKECPTVQKCIVLKHAQWDIPMKEGRDVWYHDIVDNANEYHAAVTVDAEDPLFILYTSGSTGKPKGVLHTTGGYMVWTGFTFINVFHYKPEQIFWCTADIGWVTGHSYIVYGPLLNGATTLMYEGVLQYPDYSRWWQIVEKHKVNIFYTAPTAIRSLQAQGAKWFEGIDLSSLQVLGSVGEPINEEAWHWYYNHVGQERCPVVDTWWQTETGGILISALAGVTPAIPGFATLPMPGVEPVLVDSDGNEIEEMSAEGNLCIRHSWPGQARTVYGDHERFIQTYFSTYKGMYFTGDGCRRDENGNYRITGRVDDVVNVSGHRIGTAEVENAIDEHPAIVESAVVGYPHDIKGQGLYAFVICDHKMPIDEETLKKEVQDMVSKMIGSFAKPDKILITSGLPKTRSGKIMRRILRKIAEGEPDKVGDISTLLNPEIVDEIKRKAGY